MAEIQHFSHECPLTSPKIVADGICSICNKDELVILTCSPCDFNLCRACSQLPQKVSHDFHPDHPLEFCLHQYDQKPAHIVCSGCGNMSSGSFYECKECEIYLDLDCALQENIFRGWEVKELLHDNHWHLLRRSRPGLDARGSCLLCELPLSPSCICYGCIHCYLFFHERCLDLPREIQHPVHLSHPLKRLDHVRAVIRCSICGEYIDSTVPFSCQECNIDFHMRCLDSFLRGLMHKSHHHKLFYRTNARRYRIQTRQCQICMRALGSRLNYIDSYFWCMECDMFFHFECLGIPESVVNKSHHIHPLVCKVLLVDDGFFEYCGVCETMVYPGHRVYACEQCDFLGHIECILRKEVPSPLYLKDLYSYSKENTNSRTDQVEHEAKLTVNSNSGHNHVMRLVDMSELVVDPYSHYKSAKCDICKETIYERPFQCETCNFRTHYFCAELGQPLMHRVHWKHPLTLLPSPPAPAWITMTCDVCKKNIEGFNLCCRLCNFIIHPSCIFKSKQLFRESQRGQKIIGRSHGSRCVDQNHDVEQVMVTKSYPRACAICDERMGEKVLSCMTCEDVYHPLCIEVVRVPCCHPLHPVHNLKVTSVSGSMCRFCKLEIKKYGYHCSTCNIDFHFKCIKAARLPIEVKPDHNHYFYNFWNADSSLTRTCCVCAKPCGVSFYGCIGCDFNVHAECIGFPSNVKTQQHQHTLLQIIRYNRPGYNCFICERSCSKNFYYCELCDNLFHLECIMSTDDRKAATEEDQYGDIYLMSIERHLLELLENDEESDSS